MPYKYFPPNAFFEYKKIKIYHVYKDNYVQQQLEFWFTTDVLEREEFEFDIRDLKQMGKGCKYVSHIKIFKWAIHWQFLLLPKGVKYY